MKDKKEMLMWVRGWGKGYPHTPYLLSLIKLEKLQIVIMFQAYFLHSTVSRKKNGPELLVCIGFSLFIFSFFRFMGFI